MPLREKAKLACALVLVLAFVLGATGAFAFSYSDGLAGGGGTDSLVDPDSRLDAISDQMSRMWDTPSIDYSDQFSGASVGGQDSAAPAQAPRPPVSLGRGH